MRIRLIDFGYDKAPKRAHYNDAGADVYAPSDVTLKPHQTMKIPLGFGLDLPDGLAAYVLPRSSMASKGIVSQIPPVDSGYKGNIHCIITNTTDCDYDINRGDRIAQIIIVPFIAADFSKDFNDCNERGIDGFGSTGV